MEHTTIGFTKLTTPSVEVFGSLCLQGAISSEIFPCIMGVCTEDVDTSKSNWYDGHPEYPIINTRFPKRTQHADSGAHRHTHLGSGSFLVGTADVNVHVCDAMCF